MMLINWYVLDFAFVYPAKLLWGKKIFPAGCTFALSLVLEVFETWMDLAKY